tara:strand:+ start:122 stop:385 length:264 start_codon:yes stop_codon:yes gene_type:complete
MKWTDLIFRPHHAVKNGVSCRVEFDNGEWCSIVGAPYDVDQGFFSLYGNGKTSFEIYSSVTKKTPALVKGWLSRKQVLRHLNYLKNK